MGSGLCCRLALSWETGPRAALPCQVSKCPRSFSRSVYEFVELGQSEARRLASPPPPMQLGSHGCRCTSCYLQSSPRQFPLEFSTGFDPLQGTPLGHYQREGSTWLPGFGGPVPLTWEAGSV